MAPRTLRTFRVTVDEWMLYDTLIEALDRTEALEKAQELYDAEGNAGFQHFNCGNDGFTIEEVLS